MKNECKCTATLSKDDPRYELWIQVVENAEVPLKHPLPVKHPKFEGVFYEGDASRLTEKQKKKLVELLSKKFKVPKSHVKEALEKNILPIKGDNCIISICDLHFRCML